MSVNTNTERLRIPKSGAVNSDDVNKFADSVINDLTNLQTQSNANESNIDAQLSVALKEMRNLQQRVNQLEKRNSFDGSTRAAGNLRIMDFKSLGDFTGITFPAGSPITIHPSIETAFGQATVPVNGIQSKFYSNSIIAGSIVPITDDLNIVVTPINEAVAIRTLEGEPKNAFNGNNFSYWIRRLEYDIDSDVSEVEIELKVQIPDQANAEANVIYIRPYPSGQTDITTLATSPDLTDSFTTVSGFTSVDSSADRRYIFTPAVVSQVKIRLRQRNWFEENGRKVFELGLQELGLQLVEFDRTYTAGGALNTNHTFITKFVAPQGYFFSGLHMFDSSPDFTKESASNRHMHFKIAMNADGTDIRWDSDTHPLPQTRTQGITLGGAVANLYVVTTLNWVETADGGTPLFPVSTTPVLTGFGLQYSVVPE